MKGFVADLSDLCTVHFPGLDMMPTSEHQRTSRGFGLHLRWRQFPTCLRGEHSSGAKLCATRAAVLTSTRVRWHQVRCSLNTIV